jgi:hypothetical protein
MDQSALDGALVPLQVLIEQINAEIQPRNSVAAALLHLAFPSLEIGGRGFV